MRIERIGGYYGWTLFKITGKDNLEYRLQYIHPTKRETIATVDLLRCTKCNDYGYRMYLNDLKGSVESSDWKNIAKVVNDYARTNKKWPGYPPYFPTQEQLEWMLTNQDVLRRRKDDVQ